MSQIFNQVEYKAPKGNSFDLSFDTKTTTNMGRLTPVLLKECVPGDIWDLRHEALVRFAPMLAPIMHRVDVFMHTFFVPNRLSWNNWEGYITGGLDGANASAPPMMNDFTTTESSLGAYLGLPDGQFNGTTGRVSAIPFAAYLRIWYEFYRDENLGTTDANILSLIKDTLIDGVASSGKTTVLNTLRQRAWNKDYFTSSLPFAQKGSPVFLPLTFTDVPVIYGSGATLTRQATTLVGPVDGTVNALNAGQVIRDAGNNALNLQTPAVASTSTMTGGSTINDFRRAMRLQEWLEKNATGGSRYTESLYAHFGVKSSDSRLQRPEFIGGFKQPVSISEVLQTSGTIGGTPQGTMAGHAISVAGSRPRKYFVEEHGYIMTIMSVLPRTAYQQGIERHWTRPDKYAYYWPEFAELGEQAVLNKEIFHSNSDGLNEMTFGYQSRYSEMKSSFAMVSGAFRSSLSYWHMGRIFATRPLLNASFVQSDPTHRIFAVTTDTIDKLYCHVLHRVRARRLMPIFGTPSIS